eukprot:Awhi_evm2s9813
MNDTQTTNLDDKLNHLEAQLIALIEKNKGVEETVTENRALLQSQEMRAIMGNFEANLRLEGEILDKERLWNTDAIVINNAAAKLMDKYPVLKQFIPVISERCLFVNNGSVHLRSDLAPWARSLGAQSKAEVDYLSTALNVSMSGMVNSFILARNMNELVRLLLGSIVDQNELLMERLQYIKLKEEYGPHVANIVKLETEKKRPEYSDAVIRSLKAARKKEHELKMAKSSRQPTTRTSEAGQGAGRGS